MQQKRNLLLIYFLINLNKTIVQVQMKIMKQTNITFNNFHSPCDIATNKSFK